MSLRRASANFKPNSISVSFRNSPGCNRLTSLWHIFTAPDPLCGYTRILKYIHETTARNMVATHISSVFGVGSRKALSICRTDFRAEVGREGRSCLPLLSKSNMSITCHNSATAHTRQVSPLLAWENVAVDTLSLIVVQGKCQGRSPIALLREMVSNEHLS